MKRMNWMGFLGTSAILAMSSWGCATSAPAEVSAEADAVDNFAASSASQQNQASTDSNDVATNDNQTTSTTSDNGGSEDTGQSNNNDSGGSGNNSTNSVAGDQNGDNLIDDSDARALSRAFGSNRPESDLNHDGKVDILDLALLLSMIQ